MIQIRKPVPGDEDAITTVHIKTWQTTYAGFMDQAYLDSLESTRESRRTMWKSGIQKQADKAFWVAENDGKIVGFVIAGGARDEGRDGELYAIYVLKEHQQKGVGKQLFNKAAETLRELGHVSAYLWVVKGNPTERFYAAMGGKPADEKTVEIGGKSITEIRYEWERI